MHKSPNSVFGICNEHGCRARDCIAELEAEVERLRAVCESQNLLIEVKERDDG